MDLPQYNNSSKKGEVGLTIVKTFVQDKLNWMFRKNHQEEDFGIDAYFDIITEARQVTGKSIAVQIKTRPSYFEEKNDIGWVYRGELKHLNYYLNHQIPVILVIVDEFKKEAYWNLCDASKTIRAGESWKITIPFNQRLNANSKHELEKYISPVTDYVSQLDHYWKVNNLLMKNSRILFVVDKSDILKGNTDYLFYAFKRLEANPELILQSRHKIDVSIHGYDEDPRELFVIPESKALLKSIFPRNDSWSYFLAMDEGAAFLKLLFISHSNVTKIESNKIEYEMNDSAPFVKSLFDGLNSFCDRNNISDETNIEIVDKLMDYLSNGEFRDYMNSEG